MRAQPKCPKHPSIPAAFCACRKHKPVDTKLYTQPTTTALNRVRTTLSAHSEWSLTLRDGVITICGVCWELAATHSGTGERDHTCKLTAFIRTKLCKHCGDTYEQNVPCGARDFGLPHERKWLIRSAKVPACPTCATKAEYEVEAQVLTDIMESKAAGRPPEPVRIWRHALQERGLL